MLVDAVVVVREESFKLLATCFLVCWPQLWLSKDFEFRIDLKFEEKDGGKVD